MLDHSSLPYLERIPRQEKPARAKPHCRFNIRHSILDRKEFTMSEIPLKIRQADLFEAMIAANIGGHVLFKNESAQPIYVVMDTDRQHELIAGGGAASFRPNCGDCPTYHVWSVDGAGKPIQQIYADSFCTLEPFPPRCCRDLKWTGSKIERD